MAQQIILREKIKPAEKIVEKDIFWLCDSLGFSQGRDIEHISTRLVTNILKNYSTNELPSADLLADELEITPSRVNHHVRNLIESGFIYRQNRMILLRGGSMKSAIKEIRKDAERIFDELEHMAQDIDMAMGLKNRD